jgi:hypothetical protein
MTMILYKSWMVTLKGKTQHYLKYTSSKTQKSLCYGYNNSF